MKLYKKLLLPILHIHTNTYVCNTEIKQLLRTYKNISYMAASKWTSKYNTVENYTSYVYLITDTIQTMYYIGVRFTPNKFHDNPLEDLKRYQTSSRNLVFKKLLEDDIVNDGKRFKLTILNIFNNEFDAQNYEALLHQIYKVSSNSQFYNKTTEVYKELKVYLTPLWDLQENKKVFYKDIVDFITYGDVQGALKRRFKGIIKDKYCLYTYKNSIISKYQLYNTYVSLYWYCNITQQIITETRIYKEWISYIGTNFIPMFEGSRNRVTKYYINYELCYAESQKYEYVTLYTYENYNICCHTKTIHEWEDLLGYDFIKLCNGICTHIKGYYIDRKICENYTECIEMFKYNNEICVGYKYPVHKWLKILNIDYNRFKSYSLNNSIKEYYFNKEKCIYDYEYTYGYNTLYTYDYTNRKGVSITEYHKVWRELLGGSYNCLLNKSANTISIKSYFHNIADCITSNLEYTFLNTITNETITIYDYNSAIIPNFSKIRRGIIFKSKEFILLPTKLSLY